MRSLQTAKIEDELRCCLAEVLEVSPGAIRPDLPLTALGFDSLAIVELRSEIEQIFGVELPIDLFLRELTLADLTAHVVGYPRPHRLHDALPPSVHRKSRPTNVELDTLWEHSRFPALSWPQRALLLLYAPVGALLFVTRLSLLILVTPVALLLPSTTALSRFCMKVVAFIVGAIVRIENPFHLDPRKSRVIVSNHVFTLEGAIWLSQCASSVVMRGNVARLWVFRLFTKHAKVIATDSPNRLRDVLSRVREGDRPVFCFPEGATTNGKIGVLRYHPFLFSLGLPVQPVALKIERPLPINISLLQPHYVRDALWNLFVPWTRYTFTLLPIQQRRPDETTIDFADHVQQATASHLGLAALRYTVDDKARLRAIRHWRKQVQSR
jgi:ancient ubiquitous protein 1